MALSWSACRRVCSSPIPFDLIAYHFLTVLCLISPSVATGPTVIRKPVSVRLRRTVLSPTSLNTTVASPTDSFLHFPMVSYPAGQSFLITDSPLPDSPTLSRGPSLRTIASGSTSSETKRVNRLTALACLEGRGRSPRKNHSNFMSMSDDEDEDDTIAPSHSPSADHETSRGLSIITVGNVPSTSEDFDPFALDSAVASSPQQSKMASVRSRHRSRTMESWFPPLANFIDLRSEEDPPNWRSFIEFSPTTA